MEGASGGAPAQAASTTGVGSLGLVHLIGAGLADSTGLAFGWTVLLLVVARQQGLAAAALLTSSSLIGMALAAPFSAWISARWSPRQLLQRLAVAEAITRASLFAIMAVGGAAAVMAPLAVLTSMIAWSAYAAMRTQVSKATGSDGESAGAGLTWYAAAILASEAVAAGGASLLVGHPSPPVLLLVAAFHTCSLAPQWWVGAHADPAPATAAPTSFGLRTIIRPVIVPVAVGGLVYLVAAGPALMAAVLAFERYGAAGVVLAAGSFAAGSLGSARLQSWVTRIPSPGVAACLLGAAMVACWTVFSLGLPALALAMLCVGLTQCCIEGDLDARTLAGLGPEPSRSVAGLAMASSSRAVGGAVAVAVLPTAVTWVTLPVAAALAGAVLLAAAAALSALSALARTPRAAAPTTTPPLPPMAAAEHARRGHVPRRPRLETGAEAGERSARSLAHFMALVGTLADLAGLVDDDASIPAGGENVAPLRFGPRTPLAGRGGPRPRSSCP